MRVIKPGDSAGSKLHAMVSGDGQAAHAARAARRCRPTRSPLLKEWIDSGANWPADGATARVPGRLRHCAAPSPPRCAEARWKRNAIDAFILAKLDSKSIRPSPEADRAHLLRRRLPRSDRPAADTRADGSILADKRPDAYERLVDRLLASPHYGEKWSRQWLDLARYADSEGGVQDYARPFAWRYREWVIDAFNADMPFDRFTIEQMAGDLLPNADTRQEDRHRLSPKHDHQSRRWRRTRPHPLRAARGSDEHGRTVWLGLTVGCAQCHDHKYDPITQKDFYRLMAFFENGDEVDHRRAVAG